MVAAAAGAAAAAPGLAARPGSAARLAAAAAKVPAGGGARSRLLANPGCLLLPPPPPPPCPPAPSSLVEPQPGADRHAAHSAASPGAAKLGGAQSAVRRGLPGVPPAAPCPGAQPLPSPRLARPLSRWLAPRAEGSLALLHGRGGQSMIEPNKEQRRDQFLIPIDGQRAAEPRRAPADAARRPGASAHPPGDLPDAPRARPRAPHSRAAGAARTNLESP